MNFLKKYLNKNNNFEEKTQFIKEEKKSNKSKKYSQNNITRKNSIELIKKKF